MSLDRRRLEDAHIIYAVLNVMRWYPDGFSEEDKILKPAHFNDMLSHRCFSEKYAGNASMTIYTAYMYYKCKCVNLQYKQILCNLDHSCDTPGCGSVLVIDGNMKNHRDVCSATEAGFITFQGLPGKVKTGCQLTPDLRSRYCSKHKPRVCMKPMDDTKDNNSKVDKEEDVAEMIIAEKVTRSATYYQVQLYLSD